MFRITFILLFFLFSNLAFSEQILTPLPEISYSPGQGLLPLGNLQDDFDVEFNVNMPDCMGRHTYTFGHMTIYRGAVDHKFRILYKYETPNVACFITLISKSDQLKYVGSGWDSPWVDPRPDKQVWCLSPNPTDCEMIKN